MKKLFLVFILHIVSGLYEDQAGKFDWRSRYIGKPDYILLEQPFGGASNIRRIFVGSKSNVVASVNARSGDLHWRHIMEENGRLIALTSCDRYVFSLSEGNGIHLRGWDSSLGNIVWENFISDDKNAKAFLRCNLEQSTLYMLMNSQVFSYDFNSGKERWRKSVTGCNEAGNACDIQLYSNVEASEADSKHKVKSGSGVVVYTSLPHRANVRLQLFSSEGASVRDISLKNEFDKDGEAEDTKCLWVNSASSLVCHTYGSDKVHIAGAEAGAPAFRGLSLKAHNVKADRLSLAELSDFSCVLLDGHRQTAVLRFNGAGGPSLSALPHPTTTLAAAQLGDNEFLLTVHRQPDQPFRNVAVRVYRHNPEQKGWAEEAKLAGQLQLAQHHGNVDKIWTIMFAKKDGTLAYRLLILCEDYSIHMFQQSGKHRWLREEALSTILSAEMIDLPLSENQAKMEEEFGHGGDIIGMFLNRLRTQFSQLKTFVQERLRQHSRGGAAARPDMDSAMAQDSELDGAGGAAPVDEVAAASAERDEAMTRDEFNLNKIIVVATAAGKLFGMDSRNGRSVWKYWIPGAGPFGDAASPRMPLFVQRTTAHFPLQPQVTVLVKHKVSARPMIFSFNPITGMPLASSGNAVETLSYEVLQANMLPFVGEDFLRPILLLDRVSKVHIYPSSYRLNCTEHPVYLYTLDGLTGRLQGYRVQEDALFSTLWAAPIWNINLASRERHQRVVTLASRHQNEHVHSVGRILGDRSVLYKYLNPNLVAAAVEHFDPSSQKNSLTIYLVDVVAGAIVYSAHHAKAGQPFHMVHSENWVVYSYWNQKSRRFESSVLELYDPTVANTTSKGFSSLDRPVLQPSVLRQGYILPTSVQKMAVSITEKGITSKSILLVLKTGAILEVPKAFFDPRRSLEMTMELQEEGVLPYMPELPLNTEAIINYYNSVLGVRGVHSAPAGLESTSLVFVYGNDLFFTRVAPSKMYDVLKEDFDYFFIASVTLGMIVASVVTQKLAARKALYRAWQ